MKPFIQLTLSSGHVFEVPTEVIAQDRAKVMQSLHPLEFPKLEDALTDTRELFEDSYEVREWALNNMDHEDYISVSRLIRFVPQELPISSAEWSYHDHPATMGEMDGEQILRSPVEAVISSMANANQLCNVSVLNDKDGAPFALLALCHGSPKEIAMFITGLQFISERATNDAGAPSTIITH